jgi:hypothetical protein
VHFYRNNLPFGVDLREVPVDMEVCFTMGVPGNGFDRDEKPVVLEIWRDPTTYIRDFQFMMPLGAVKALTEHSDIAAQVIFGEEVLQVDSHASLPVS